MGHSLNVTCPASLFVWLVQNINFLYSAKENISLKFAVFSDDDAMTNKMASQLKLKSLNSLMQHRGTHKDGAKQSNLYCTSLKQHYGRVQENRKHMLEISSGLKKWLIRPLVHNLYGSRVGSRVGAGSRYAAQVDNFRENISFLMANYGTCPQQAYVSAAFQTHYTMSPHGGVTRSVDVEDGERRRQQLLAVVSALAVCTHPIDEEQAPQTCFRRALAGHSIFFMMRF